MYAETDAGTVTITSKNMIVIPKKAREKFHLQQGQKLHVLIEDNEVVLVPIISLDKLAGILKGPKTAKKLVMESRKNISRYD